MEKKEKFCWTSKDATMQRILRKWTLTVAAYFNTNLRTFDALADFKLI